jgi:hypothetical protein
VERGLFLIEKRLLKWNVALDSNLFDTSNDHVLGSLDPVLCSQLFLNLLPTQPVVLLYNFDNDLVFLF